MLISSYRADRPSRIVNNAMNPLARTVARFCDTLARLPEHDASHVQPCHRAENAELHEQAINIREHLIHLGNAIDDLRYGEPITRTRSSLHHLQRAYRSLQGLMIGVPDRLLDQGQSRPHGTIRHLLLACLNFYHLHAPTPEPSPLPIALREAPTAAPALHDSGHFGADPLSTLFERSERLHRAVVDKLCSMPEDHRLPEHQADIEARLSRLESHLLEQHVDLIHLVGGAGHCRTESMWVAYKIFVALGHAEGAMIGAEARFKNICQPAIDLIDARTNELGHYCRIA